MLMDNTSFNGENQASMPMRPIAQGAPKKQGGKTVIIAIIALLIGAAAASTVFICLNGGFDFSKKEAGNTSEQKKDEKKKDAEATITDEKTIKELAEKTNIVLARGYDKTSDKAIITWDFNYKFDSFNDLKKSEKMGDIVRLFAYDNQDVQSMTKTQLSSLTNSEIEVLKKYADWTGRTTDGLESAFVVFKNDAEVKKKYQYVFGETLSEMPEKADGSSVVCGNYVYLPSLDVFVAGNGCGDLGAAKLQFKQLDYKQTDNQAFVYFIADVLTSEYGDEDVAHYAGLSKKNKISNDVEAFSNESAYVKYRAVFDKQDDGNYAYKTIEEVKG